MSAHAMPRRDEGWYELTVPGTAPGTLYKFRIDGEIATLVAHHAEVVPDAPTPTDDDLPVEAMHYTIADHYRENAESLPLVDRSHFDGDLRTLFASAVEAPTAEPAQSTCCCADRRETSGHLASGDL